MTATLTRRAALASLGCAAGAAAFPGLIPEALARAPTNKRLIVLILRGGMDGLGAVPALGDPHFKALRGPLAVPAGQALELGGGFAAHPALETFGALYQDGDAAVLHAVCSPYRKRSHFDGQDVLETGGVRVGGFRDGWMNRALSLMNGDGLGVGTTIPLALRGAAPVRGYAPQTLPPVGEGLLERLAAIYDGDAALADTLDQARRDAAAIAAAMGDGEDAPKRGPKAEAHTAKTVGGLMAMAEGPRIAALGFGGWDTHANQGALNGRLAKRLAALDAALAALREGLGAAWRDSVVLVVTEFGRTVRANGTGGSDHGVGGAAFVLGGALNGGRVIADWPGLGPNALFQNRDLAPTRDLRGLFAAALTGHLGLPAPDVRRAVFPDLDRDRAVETLFA